MPRTGLRLTPNSTAKELERAYDQGLLRPDQLEHGAYYRGQCKAATVARWHGELKRFVFLRPQFGGKVIDQIAHPAQGKTHDIFMPLEKVAPQESEQICDEDFNRHT